MWNYSVDSECITIVKHCATGLSLIHSPVTVQKAAMGEQMQMRKMSLLGSWLCKSSYEMVSLGSRAWAISVRECHLHYGLMKSDR